MSVFPLFGDIHRMGLLVQQIQAKSLYLSPLHFCSSGHVSHRAIFQFCVFLLNLLKTEKIDYYFRCLYFNTDFQHANSTGNNTYSIFVITQFFFICRKTLR